VSPRLPLSGLVAVLFGLLLAACGSTPAPTGDLPPVAGSESSPAKRSPPKGGGYYKDDGPGDEIPDGLDDVPDAQPRPEPLHRFANRPYVVFGKEYVPNTAVKPYKARGIASWYGKKFHGQRTSIGEPYNMFAMTAAHPTLAIPSYARVTNVANGRSVVVRIIDRGPFHAGRLIDLSYAAAHKLDYIRSGSTLVEVEALVPDATGVSYAQVAQAEPRPLVRPDGEELARLAAEARAEPPAAPAAASPASGVLLQLGAFANADNAESLRARMARELDGVDGELRVSSAGGIHRLQLGPFASRAEAERVAERIQQAHGFRPSLVTR